MQELLNNIGVDTQLLHKEPLHTRKQTLEILDKTLCKYENLNLIKGSRFKAKKYYTKDAIIDCIKTHFNINKTSEFDNIWD